MRLARKAFSTAFALSVLFLAAIPSAALEKKAAREAGDTGEVLLHGKAVPALVLQALLAGEPGDLIVEFDGGPVQLQAETLRAERGLVADTAEILEMKAARYAAVKKSALAALPPEEYETLREYSHLPMSFLRFRSAAALERLLERPDVVAVYEDQPARKLLNQSLPLIGQPAAAAAGHRGAGSTVAVLDGGVDYTRPAFGSCTSPGVPAGCKVVVYQDFADPDGALDDPDLHGTNVSGIVVGVAPDSRIAGLDVFNNDSTTSTIVIAGINFAISNRATYNIVAMNLSLGGTASTTPCSASPYTTPFASARSAGIVPVVASGNDGFTDQIASPACAPGAVSVGAVYDSDLGPSQGSCTDATTGADKVTCFSNSASFLTLLAPGAFITAALVTQAGTSQASPHVAGGVAVLRSLFPGDSIDQTVTRMTSTGVLVTDARNGIVKPRLSLQAATGAAPRSCASQTISCPGTASGNLATSDCLTGQRSAGEFTDSYQFSGTAGQTVTINMSSPQFDTLLFLINPSGGVAESNDDISSTDFNSRIVFRLNATGTWRVEASSFGPAATGSYTLSLSGCSGGTPSVCTPGGTNLCLAASRFKVEVTWRAVRQGTSGVGTAAPLTSDTGYFWFFNSANVELVIKVLDARVITGRFWVFYGALSDVEYTITVTDTTTGAVKTYFNPQDRLASVADTAAF